MLSFPSASPVYLACGATDIRKSIDGLVAIVQEQFELNPFSSALFVFCNRRRDKFKILHWDHAGFCRILQLNRHEYINEMVTLPPRSTQERTKLRYLLPAGCGTGSFKLVYALIVAKRQIQTYVSKEAVCLVNLIPLGTIKIGATP
ncbi:IS66 family insertion sequence element accessory protein TnpB [Paenibacillus agri]|uniref:IS66 family insertion sequence element accessory protein TnpB n=1 Tax=Paenibacillus agri TaxID=2744309 RepID=A0A850EKP5_9BACL|nr:IS66 family insertion sequence element accessory protein TnpB [Paenibacillus agri]